MYGKVKIFKVNIIYSLILSLSLALPLLAQQALVAIDVHPLAHGIRLELRYADGQVAAVALPFGLSQSEVLARLQPHEALVRQYDWPNRKQGDLLFHTKLADRANGLVTELYFEPSGLVGFATSSLLDRADLTIQWHFDLAGQSYAVRLAHHPLADFMHQLSRASLIDYDLRNNLILATLHQHNSLRAIGMLYEEDSGIELLISISYRAGYLEIPIYGRSRLPEAIYTNRP